MEELLEKLSKQLTEALTRLEAIEEKLDSIDEQLSDIDRIELLR